jgi:methyl-accepting chemotaxis protein
MRFGDISIRKKILFGAAIPSVLMAVLACISYMTVERLLGSVSFVDHSHRVINNSLAVQDAADRMDASVRGYLLTGRFEFLEPFRQSEDDLDTQMQNLKDLSKDDPEKLKLISEFAQVIQTWKATRAVPAIELREEISKGKDMDDLGKMVAEGSGKEKFDKFRFLMRQFADNEDKLLAELEAKINTQPDLKALQGLTATISDSHNRIEMSSSIRGAALDVESGAAGFLLTGREEFLEPYYSGEIRLFDSITREKQLVESDAAQLKLLTEIESVLKDWKNNSIEPEIKLRRQIVASKTMTDLKKWLEGGEDKKLFDNFRALANSYEDREKEMLKQREANAHYIAFNAKKVLLIAPPIIILVGLILSYLFAGTLTKPLDAAVSLAETVSAGDLTKTLELKGNDELGRLAAALNKMVKSLADHIQRVLEGVNVLSAAAVEISATINQLSSNTMRTSAAVSETTTTVEEVKQAAQISADQAKNVSERAQKAVSTSESGRQATADTIQRMNMIKDQMEAIGETVVRLSEQGKAIEEIIGTVQDLADQSNLLAVNASIEAARAGDQGKGFAVVAQEIKNLADQSRKATEQVRGILEETRKWVNAVVMSTEQGGKAVTAGVRQSELADESIRALTSGVTESAQAARIIESSSTQQFVGVDLVATAMANIDQAMQQNLAGTVQLETAADKLEHLGEFLKDLVANYKT